MRIIMAKKVTLFYTLANAQMACCFFPVLDLFSMK